MTRKGRRAPFGHRQLAKPVVLGLQAAIVGVFLLVWENASSIPVWGGEEPILDPFFISQPSRIYHELDRQFFGQDGRMFEYVWATVRASVIGVALGLVLGAAVGLIMSNSLPLSQVLRPFLVAFNAIPRIALIPVIVILFGPSFRASVANCFLVVFFVAFFNAYEGGRTVPSHVLQNASLLGATRFHIMRRVRLPYVIAWTFAALPLAVTFGLVTVVTTEILTGYAGVGRLIVASLNTAQSSLTFAAVVVLGAVGLIVVLLAEQAKLRVLHWWGSIDSGTSG